MKHSYNNLGTKQIRENSYNSCHPCSIGATQGIWVPKKNKKKLDFVLIIVVLLQY